MAAYPGPFARIVQNGERPGRLKPHFLRNVRELAADLGTRNNLATRVNQGAHDHVAVRHAAAPVRSPPRGVADRTPS